MRCWLCAAGEEASGSLAGSGFGAKAGFFEAVGVTGEAVVSTGKEREIPVVLKGHGFDVGGLEVFLLAKGVGENVAVGVEKARFVAVFEHVQTAELKGIIVRAEDGVFTVNGAVVIAGVALELVVVPGGEDGKHEPGAGDFDDANDFFAIDDALGHGPVGLRALAGVFGLQRGPGAEFLRQFRGQGVDQGGGGAAGLFGFDEVDGSENRGGQEQQASDEKKEKARSSFFPGL